VWSKDPESYAGGSLATGRASLAGHVDGDDPDKERHPPTPRCYVWLALIRAEGVNGTWVMCL
jgi:hypothetical protein